MTCVLLLAQVTCESDGLCRVGWATMAASYEIGKDKRSFGYGSTGNKSYGGSFEDYGSSFGEVHCFLHLWFSHTRVPTS